MDERGKLLESAIAQIEKQYGKGAIMRLGNRDVLVPVSVNDPLNRPVSGLTARRRAVSAAALGHFRPPEAQTFRYRPV